MIILPDTLGRFARALGAGSWTLQPAQGRAVAPLEACRLVLYWARRQAWGSHGQKLAPATSLPGRARFCCCSVETKVLIFRLPPFIFWLSLSASLSVALGNSWETKPLVLQWNQSQARNSYPFLSPLHLQGLCSLDSEEKTHWWQVAVLISQGTAALSGAAHSEMCIVLPQIPQKKQRWGKHQWKSLNRKEWNGIVPCGMMLIHLDFHFLKSLNMQICH